MSRLNKGTKCWNRRWCETFRWHSLPGWFFGTECWTMKCLVAPEWRRYQLFFQFPFPLRRDTTGIVPLTDSVSFPHFAAEHPQTDPQARKGWFDWTKSYDDYYKSCRPFFLNWWVEHLRVECLCIHMEWSSVFSLAGHLMENRMEWRMKKKNWQWQRDSSPVILSAWWWRWRWWEQPRHSTHQ